MLLSRLFVYPLKAARGIELASSELTSQGLVHDRRFMLVDARGRFVSQRTHPVLATVEQALSPSALSLRSTVGTLEVPLAPRDGATREVEVWGDRVTARSLGRDASSYFTRLLGDEVDLVFLPHDSVREVDRDYAREGERVGFADGFPLLLACEASRAALEREAGVRVEMERFRPNLVIAESEPWAEDGWRSIVVDGPELSLELASVKPCARCTVTTVDPVTGDVGREPLVTLGRLRKRGNEVHFGQNLLVVTPLRDATSVLGRLDVGSAVRASATS